MQTGTPELEYHTALIEGDLGRIQPLMDQFFQDANVVFEISKEEMEWQVKSPATFGLSGTITPLKLGCALYRELLGVPHVAWGCSQCVQRTSVRKGCK